MSSPNVVAIRIGNFATPGVAVAGVVTYFVAIVTMDVVWNGGTSNLTSSKKMVTNQILFRNREDTKLMANMTILRFVTIGDERG